MSWMSEQARVSLKLSSLAKLILLLSSCSCSRKSCSVTGVSRMVLSRAGHTQSLSQSRTISSTSSQKVHLRDHGSGNHQFIHQLAEVAAHRLAVLQTNVHADRLLLQCLNLTADGGQVALETTQHALHPLEEQEKEEVEDKKKKKKEEKMEEEMKKDEKK